MTCHMQQHIEGMRGSGRPAPSRPVHALSLRLCGVSYGTLHRDSGENPCQCARAAVKLARNSVNNAQAPRQSLKGRQRGAPGAKSLAVYMRVCMYSTCICTGIVAGDCCRRYGAHAAP
eukprot:TRINITY_DN13771_c0_g1_i1.p1 TRINITY_DN13771_c0_g1~~TRINITY_DN13771_c0_g1_i1.p1  ORF type:complete len:118 (+),score=6.27 TRINITY_DN13771_c0_g1_i1:270-623(+)